MDKQKVQVFNNSKNDLPGYSTDLAAGFDIRADFSKTEKGNDLKGNGLYQFLGEKKLLLKPNGRVLIPTGLYMAIPDNYELQVRARSGLALKHGITVLNSPGTVDCVPKGTKIKTINGDMLVEELYEKNDKSVILSYNEELEKIKEDVLTDMWIVDDLNLIKIYVGDNELTIPEHKKVFTKRGWIMANELTHNDYVLTY